MLIIIIIIIIIIIMFYDLVLRSYIPCVNAFSQIKCPVRDS
jgi:hypothetical protein